MKKLLFLLIVTGLTQTSFSQGNNQELFDDVGVFAAPGFSTVLGSESWGGALGFIFGVDSKLIPISEQSSLVAGIGFAIQGASWEDSWDDGAGSSTHSGNSVLTYLIIPILYHHLLDNNIYVEGGIQPGILLAAKDKYDGASYDYKEYIKTVDLGIVGGAGIQVNNKLSIGGRVVFGLPGIYNDYESGDSKDHNFMFLAVLRYSFWPFDD